MCVVKTPKITNPTPAAGQDKPLPIIRNPLLDGADLLGRLRISGQSLRIDKAKGPTAATAPSGMVPNALRVA